MFSPKVELPKYFCSLNINFVFFNDEDKDDDEDFLNILFLTII